MSRTNPDSRMALAQSHDDLANRVKAGHGFWDGRRINSNPVDCRAYTVKHRKIALEYRIQSQEV